MTSYLNLQKLTSFGVKLLKMTFLKAKADEMLQLKDFI